MAGRGLNERRWFSSSLPQTLQISVFLLYWNAVLGLLLTLLAGGASIVYLALVAADGAGGFGVANERKWGYLVALVAAFLPFVFLFLGHGGGLLAGGILNLIFEIALVALLLHPMSRNYYKLWFR